LIDRQRGHLPPEIEGPLHAQALEPRAIHVLWLAAMTHPPSARASTSSSAAVARTMSCERRSPSP
jgi:hypothetical protein